MLETSAPERLNRFLAFWAKKFKFSLGKAQSTNKSPQCIGNIGLNQTGVSPLSAKYINALISAACVLSGVLLLARAFGLR
jgi:hypothetical protein